MGSVETVARWMIANGFATGHGDNLADLLSELGWQIREIRDRKAEMLAALALEIIARPAEEWHEDIGDVLWWIFPVKEPPYVGSPLDLPETIQITAYGGNDDQKMCVKVGGWPGYHTHFTLIPMAQVPNEKP